VADRDNPYIPLRLDDVSATCGEIIRKERKEILAHINRVLKLVEVRQSGGHDDELPELNACWRRSRPS
jgi:hypothetical protein